MKFTDQKLETAYEEMLKNLDTQLRLLFLAGWEAGMRDAKECLAPDERDRD